MSTQITNKKDKIIIITLFIAILLLTAGFASLVYYIKDAYADKTEIVTTAKNETFDNIETYYYGLKAIAQTHTVDKSVEIESAICAKLDIPTLHSELLESDYSVLHDIIKTYVECEYFGDIENDNNDMFVATLQGIICDMSYISSLEPDGIYSYRTWDRDIKSQANPELAKTTYDKLINKSITMMAFERIPSKVKNHTMLCDIDIANLRNIFIKEGIEGLSSYQFVTAAYITDTGDIFGQDDIEQGIRQDNYKLIVIQEFSLYDQIMEYRPDLANNVLINAVEASKSKSMTVLYIIGILVACGYSATLYVGGRLLNDIIDRNYKK